ncbi:MAG: hypothetical protein ACI4EX_05510 [Lachnospiraceae bacterium]
MNYYFLLEDEKSFMKILPKWFEYINFKCTRVADIKDVKENNYILQSGKGVTRLITKALFDTINTIICNPGKINKLVVLIDTENENEEYRKQQIFTKIKETYDVGKFDFEILVFVCNHCFESWLLGAEGLYPQGEVNLNSDFYPYYSHYNIEMFDPEEMSVPDNSDETIAQYHFHYLCELFRYRRIRYSKSKPDAVATSDFFCSMKKRIEHTEHIQSFAKFIVFIIKENNT